MKIAIVHILPLEYYPPVTNLLNVLALRTDLEVMVISTRNHKQRENYMHSGIQVHRTVYPAYMKGAFLKMLAFAEMILGPFVRLIRFQPDALLYYEPHSAYPVYLYKKYYRPRVRLFIHYHEYYATDEFLVPHMKIVNFFHRKEVKYLYKKAEWISQTNTFRLNFFSRDYPYIPKVKLHTLPNYPPESWRLFHSTSSTDGPIKLMYLGALSFENTYIREIVEYVKKNPDKLRLDIYSYKLSNDVGDYMKNIQTENVRFFSQGVDYEKIPEVAREYNVGLVLYKPHNINYSFNAPNKLFEYLACGLDVWFPKEMLGIIPYITDGTYPKVISADFSNLGMMDVNEMTSHKGLKYKLSEFQAEEAFKEFISVMEDHP